MMTRDDGVFAEIKAVSRARDAIRFAMLMPYPSRIISPPGRGKSTALRHLAKEFDGAYIEIGATDKDVMGMYLSLLNVLNGFYFGNPNKKRDALQSLSIALGGVACNVSDNKKLVIVDEFQTLEDTAKRELIRVQEDLGIALVISCNPERLAGGNEKPSRAIRQIEDRIGLNIELPALDDEDCDLIAQAYGVSGDDAVSAARALGAKTSARELCRTLQYARLTVPDGAAVRLTQIKNAVVALKGKTNALGLLKS